MKALNAAIPAPRHIPPKCKDLISSFLRELNEWFLHRYSRLQLSNLIELHRPGCSLVGESVAAFWIGSRRLSTIVDREKETIVPFLLMKCYNNGDRNTRVGLEAHKS
jgi:hypothetical protein